MGGGSSKEGLIMHARSLEFARKAPSPSMPRRGALVRTKIVSADGVYRAPITAVYRGDGHMFAVVCGKHLRFEDIEVIRPPLN